MEWLNIFSPAILIKEVVWGVLLLGKGLSGSASSPKSGWKTFAPTLNVHLGTTVWASAVRTALPYFGLA